jgi:hypothetical protein
MDGQVMARLVITEGEVRGFVRKGSFKTDFRNAQVSAFTPDSSLSTPAGARALRVRVGDNSTETTLILSLTSPGLMHVEVYTHQRGATGNQYTFGYDLVRGQSADGHPKDGNPSGATFPEFAWPPPKASARTLVPDSLVTPHLPMDSLGGAFSRILVALRRAGIGDYSVYRIPDQDGFVVVTHLENIQEDGRPMQDRFNVSPRPDRPRTLAEFIRALMHAPPGLYRVIVIAVTSATITETEHEPSPQEAEGWLHRGEKFLPAWLAKRPLAADSHCEALVYEFRRPQKHEDPPEFLPTSSLGAPKHLAGAGLWTRKDLP